MCKNFETQRKFHEIFIRRTKMIDWQFIALIFMNIFGIFHHFFTHQISQLVSSVPF